MDFLIRVLDPSDDDCEEVSNPSPAIAANRAKTYKTSIVVILA